MFDLRLKRMFHIYVVKFVKEKNFCKINFKQKFTWFWREILYLVLRCDLLAVIETCFK